MEPIPIPPPVPPVAPLTQDERTMAMAAHLGAFAGHLFPLAHVIVPFVIWQMKRESSAFVDDQGKESVNAQITLTIAGLICIPFCFLLIGFLMLAALWVAGVTFVVLAALAANEGKVYRYPYIFRLIK